MINKLLGIGFILICLSCQKADDSPAMYPILEDPINTGYYAYDINGNFVRQVGSPNVKNGTHPYPLKFGFYPNPLWYSTIEFSEFHLRLSLPSSDEGKVKNVSVFRALYNENPAEGIVENGSYLQIIGGQPIYEITTTKSVVDLTFPNNSVDADYRVYVKMNGAIHYENIAIREFQKY